MRTTQREEKRKGRNPGRCLEVVLCLPHHLWVSPDFPYNPGTHALQQNRNHTSKPEHKVLDSLFALITCTVEPYIYLHTGHPSQPNRSRTDKGDEFQQLSFNSLLQTTFRCAKPGSQRRSAGVVCPSTFRNVPVCHWRGQPCLPRWDRPLPPQTSFHRAEGLECRIGHPARKPPAPSPRHFLKATVPKSTLLQWVLLSLKIM